MQKPSAIPTLLVAALVVLISPVLVYQVLKAQGDGSDRSLRARIGAARRTLDARRWERLALRAPFLDANAGDNSVAFERSVPLAATRQMAEALRSGVPLSAESQRLLREHHGELAALRQRTHGSYVQAQVAVRSMLHLPPGIESMRANRMLLATALDAPGAECLAITADAVRAAQDRAFSRGIIGLAMLSTAYKQSAVVARRCARNASAGELSVAAAEFDALVASEVSMADVAEIEAVSLATGYEELLRELPRVPRSGEDLLNARYRPWVLSACDDLLGELAGLRARRHQSHSLALSDVTAALDRAERSMPEDLRPGMSHTRRFGLHRAALAELVATAQWLRAAAAGQSSQGTL